MNPDRLFEPPLEIPARIPMPTPEGRWAIDEWREDAWFSLTRGSGFEDHDDAQRRRQAHCRRCHRPGARSGPAMTARRCSYEVQGPVSMTGRGVRPWWVRPCKRNAEPGSDRCWQHRRPDVAEGRGT